MGGELKVKNKILFTSSIVVLIVLLIILFFYKINIPNQNYSYYDITSSKQTIKNSFKYKKSKQPDKLYDLYSDRLIDATKREFENIKEINLIEISIVENKKIYNSIDTFDGVNKIQKGDLIIYKVKYNIEYFDSSIEPIENGENTFLYFLVKNEENKWIIAGNAPI